MSGSWCPERKSGNHHQTTLKISSNEINLHAFIGRKDFSYNKLLF